MRSTLVACCLLALSSCATAHQERVATTGSILGAATDAMVGPHSHQAAEGAIIGGIIGAVAGAAVSQPGYAKPYYYPQAAYRPYPYARYRDGWHYYLSAAPASDPWA